MIWMVALQLGWLRMVPSFSRYIVAFIIIGFLFFCSFNYIFLPWYVGSNNEYYLPDLRGYYLQDAKYKLSKLGFNADYSESAFSINNKPGTIIKMSPRAFTKVKAGRTINLVVAGHRKEFMVDDYKGLSYRNAKILLKQKDLHLDTTLYEYNNKYGKDIVSFQVPKPGKIISSGTYITLGISKGAPPEYFYVPDVIGISLVKAKKLIIDAGLLIGNIDYEFQPKLIPNTILEQNRTPGMKFSMPVYIDLIISKEEE